MTESKEAPISESISNEVLNFKAQKERISWEQNNYLPNDKN